MGQEQKRLELDEQLRLILDDVYFQPPSKEKIKYPCIIYRLQGAYKTHANNQIYNYKSSYQIILIDRNPDSKFRDDIISLPYCSFDRFYVSNNLNHFVYTIYY